MAPEQWTLGQVEAALYRLRLAGAGDDTPVTLSAEGIRADVFEATRPAPRASRLAVWTGHAVVLLVLAPLIAWLWLHLLF